MSGAADGDAVPATDSPGPEWALPTLHVARRRWPARLGRFERRAGFWLWIGGPVAPGAAATTVGRVVLIRAGYEADAVLVRHEAEHVRQYRDLGLVGFLVRYLADYGRWRLRGYPHWAAYRRIGVEVEAEWVSRRWARSTVTPLR